MILDIAARIAADTVRRLRPHCKQIEVAGSIRRRKPEPKDIEIVCIPGQVSTLDLFGDGAPERCPFWISAVRSLGTIVKGDPERGRYIKIDLPSGISLDLFTATADNWGLIYAIRTGSADYSHYCLAGGWVRAGYKSIDGMLHKNGRPVPVPTEAELFDICGVPWIEPAFRTV